MDMQALWIHASGGSHKVRAHFLHEPKNEVRFCRKVTPEKRQELLDKLVVFDAVATESARRDVCAAVDPNTMVLSSSRCNPIPTSRVFPPQEHTQAYNPLRPFGVGARICPRQSTLQENWNPRLKEETDIAVARMDLSARLENAVLSSKLSLWKYPYASR